MAGVFAPVNTIRRGIRVIHSPLPKALSSASATCSVQHRGRGTSRQPLIAHVVAIGDRQPYITALIDRSPGPISRPAAADLPVKSRSPYARIAYLSTMEQLLCPLR